MTGLVKPDSAQSLALADAESARKYAEASLATATKRAYQSDFCIWVAWAEARGIKTLPGSPEAVAAFLASQAEGGASTSTVTRRAAALNLAHRVAGFPSPTVDERVRAVLSGIRRTLGTAPKKKAAATSPRILEMVRLCDATKLRGVRDRAILLLGFASALRRSELVALQVSDLEEVERGYRIHVRRSKGDQEGRGATVPVVRGLRACPVEAVKVWLGAARVAEGYLFRPLGKGGRVLPGPLTDRTVANVVKKYAKRAGYKPGDFGAHSLRSGFLTSASERGAKVFKMLAVSRHKNVDTLRGYIQAGEEFEDAAGEGLL